MSTNVLIHTSIPEDIKKKLLNYGKGELSAGIKNLIKIAESKEITIHIITEVKI